MPRLNGSLRLPRHAAGSSHRSAVRSAVSHEPEEPYMAREPGVYDTEVNVKYLKGVLQGKHLQWSTMGCGSTSPTHILPKNIITGDKDGFGHPRLPLPAPVLRPALQSASLGLVVVLRPAPGLILQPWSLFRLPSTHPCGTLGTS
ncbi:hypothetical protein EYF80_028038 [Liparis tanakae]|uniref:Uncharacterized protein n=1 Tax=Liparis tanakae TaxID=230148 RepID=A0A4Z2H7G2_9TELE|nr:hypothetical protein EYF80_028038 [Liparis tanakae]